MKKIFVAFHAAVFAFCLYAESGNSDSILEKIMSDFMDLRVEDTMYDAKKEPEKVLANIDRFEKSIASDFMLLDEEEKLAVENNILNERFGILFEDKSRKNELQKIMKEQFDITEKMSEGREVKDMNRWFLVSRGDLTSCYMVFSIKDVIKYGMQVKPLYEAVIKKDPDFFLPYISLGQWYLFAPAVAGGSKKKALTLCEKALSLTKSNSEKFFASFYYSQMLYENKQKDKASEFLSEAEMCFPDSLLVKIVREENAKGKSFFEYNREKSDLSKDVK